MRNSFWKFVVHAGRGITFALVALAALAFMALAVGPRTGRYQTATVLTGSMRPHMAEGSIVVITPLSPRDVRIGDVITYQIPVEDHRIVTHRVVEVVESGESAVVRTQGDANDAPDPWVARMEGGPLWKVRAVIPGWGYAVHALRQPLAQRVSVLVLPLVLCVVWLREIWSPPRPRAFA